MAVDAGGPGTAPVGTPPAIQNAPGAPSTVPASDEAKAAGTAPQSLTIDLADSPGGVFPRAPGTYKLRLINKLPNADYKVTSHLTSQAIPNPIDLSNVTKPTPAPVQDRATVAPACTAALTALNANLDAAMCEADVALIAQLAPSVLSSAKCDEQSKSEFLAQLDAKTTREDAEALPVVANADSLDVIVTRQAFISSQTGPNLRCRGETPGPPVPGISGTSVASRTVGTWRFEFGKAEAQWLTYYGFNFTKSGDDTFYSKTNSGSNPASFTITQEASRQNQNFSASIYALRIPAEDGFKASRIAGWKSNDWMGGLTAGLGFDFSNPTVFFGYGIGWGYNVMLTAGVVMHRETRLKGQYNPGDVITTNLTADQLVDSTYKPRAYIGVAFRLGSNPFSAPTNSKTTSSGSTTTSSKTGS